MLPTVRVKAKRSGPDRPELFFTMTRGAISAIPENPRIGCPRGEKRGPSQQQMAAAWLHCSRLSIEGIAAAVRILTGTPLSYAMLRKWRTQPDFRALVTHAAEKMSASLLAEWRKVRDDVAKRGRFADELVFYSREIAVPVILEAKRTAEESDSPGTAQIFSGLAMDWFGPDEWPKPPRLSKTKPKYDRLYSWGLKIAHGMFKEARSEGDWSKAEIAESLLLILGESAAPAAEGRIPRAGG